jgi:hypothetical protein
MNYRKVDLSQIVAVGHDNNCLEILVDRGDNLQSIAVAAPIEAYEGLGYLQDIVEDQPRLSGAPEPRRLPPARSKFVVKSVESAMASSIGYDPDRNMLQVEFNSGAVYQYEGVDQQTWQQLESAESVGKFYNQAIRGTYQGYRCQ